MEAKELMVKIGRKLDWVATIKIIDKSFVVGTLLLKIQDEDGNLDLIEFKRLELKYCDPKTSGGIALREKLIEFCETYPKEKVI